MKKKLIKLSKQQKYHWISNLKNKIPNSNTHSQTGVWEQGRSPVGRDVLFPTFVYITNKFHRSIKTLYADIFCLYGLFLYACFCRDEGNPTYGSLSLLARFYFMPILFDGALANSTLRKYDHFLLMLKGRL